MRIRITFSKTGSLRYSGHLDLQKIWERMIRRADLPLAYSQGFHPGPKIQLAAALPLGFIGRTELVDIWLESADLNPHLLALLQNTAPPGLTILGIEKIVLHAPALQTQVTSAEYEVTLLSPADDAALSRRIFNLLETESLPRERRGRHYDLRPLIEALNLLTENETSTTRISMRLAAREGATGRPEEVLETIGIPFETTRIERTRLIMKSELK